MEGIRRCKISRGHSCVRNGRKPALSFNFVHMNFWLLHKKQGLALSHRGQTRFTCMPQERVNQTVQFNCVEFSTLYINKGKKDIAGNLLWLRCWPFKHYAVQSTIKDRNSTPKRDFNARIRPFNNILRPFPKSYLSIEVISLRFPSQNERLF